MKSPARKGVGAKKRLTMDSAYENKKEKERRRLLRLQQVRLGAAEAAKTVRQRVKREQMRQIRKIASQELQNYCREKSLELAALEAEYQDALRDLGLGHEGLAEHRAYERWKAEQALQQSEVANVRGEHAISVVTHRRMLDEKLKQEKVQFKKSVRLAEDARAAELRAKQSKLKGPFSLGHVEEIPIPDSSSLRRVQFEGQPLRDLNVNVRRISSKSYKPGVEAAIIEQENMREINKRHLAAARMRGLAALKRARMAKEQLYSRFPSESESESEDFRTPTLKFQDLDSVPVKGQTSTSTSSSSISMLHATVTRYPTDEQGRPLMGGPSSAFSTQRSKSMEITGFSTKSNVQSEEKKKEKSDVDFIAQVLHGFEVIQQEEAVKVKVNVEEISAASSSSASTDIGKEKFLANTGWPTDYGPIHGLIGQLKKRSPKEEPSDLERSQVLRQYIEQLLKLKRQEIADLSLTTTTSSSSSSSQFASSTPNSILSSTSSSGNNKTVRFSEDTHDASYRPKEETKMSLAQVQEYYEEQRQIIEAELEERMKKKKEQQQVLSEGPLTTSQSSSNESKASKSASSSTKESPPSDDEEKVVTVQRRPSPRGQQQLLAHQRAVRLNKSSSSGTTTSGSVATAELLSRLRQLELPSLERPPPQSLPPPPRPRRTRPQRVRLPEDSEDLNTSADLQKAPELESSEVEAVVSTLPRRRGQPASAFLEAASTFRFSSDDDDKENISNEPELSYISLSSDI